MARHWAITPRAPRVSIDVCDLCHTDCEVCVRALLFVVGYIPEYKDWVNPRFATVESCTPRLKVGDKGVFGVAVGYAYSFERCTIKVFPIFEMRLCGGVLRKSLECKI